MLQQKQQNDLPQLVEDDEVQVEKKVALNDAEVQAQRDVLAVQRDALAVHEENAQPVLKEEDVVRLPNFSFLYFFLGKPFVQKY